MPKIHQPLVSEPLPGHDPLPMPLPEAPPEGIMLRSNPLGEELRLSRRRPTHFAQLAVLLTVVAVGVCVAGVVGGFEKAGLLMSGLSLAGAVALQVAHRRLRRAPPQVIVLSQRGMVVDGLVVDWEHIASMRRTHSSRGGGLLIITEERALELAGELRPTGVDWLELRLARHRAASRPTSGPAVWGPGAPPG